MLNGVGTNISMAYTSNYNKKSTGDKMDIEFEIGNSEQNSLNKCGERQSEFTEIYMNMLSENNSSLYNKLVNNKNAVEQVSPDKEIPNDKLKNIGMTSFGLSDTESQIVLASYVKTSKEDDPVVQVAYGHGDNRKVYHVHVNDVDTSNASDLEMFALMSYEGYKGRTAPNSINNYSAYKTMKADAGYGMASTDENSFVNKKVNADYLLEQIYDSLKKRETEERRRLRWKEGFWTCCISSAGLFMGPARETGAHEERSYRSLCENSMCPPRPQLRFPAFADKIKRYVHEEEWSC